MLKRNVNVPIDGGSIKLKTNGIPEIGDVPSPALVMNAIPILSIIIPIANTT